MLLFAKNAFEIAARVMGITLAPPGPTEAFARWLDHTIAVKRRVPGGSVLCDTRSAASCWVRMTMRRMFRDVHGRIRTPRRNGRSLTGTKDRQYTPVPLSGPALGHGVSRNGESR